MNSYTKHIAFVFILILLACSAEHTAKVVVISKQEGRTDEGILYLDITIKNEGDIRAEYIIVQVTAMKDSQKVDYREREFNDLNPGGTDTGRITFPDLMNTQPDDYKINITYVQAMPVQAVPNNSVN